MIDAIDLRLGRWQDVLQDVEQVDAVITDPPYSERTHKGHDVTEGVGGTRNALGYRSWNGIEWGHFLTQWSDRCRGWFVVLTSHDLVPMISELLDHAGRYVFASLPYVAPGSRVRLQGDGPSCWTCWIVVARPRTKEFSTWGTLPGAYTLPKGYADSDMMPGGKPLWLLRALVRDYSRPGDLVVDSCSGLCTTGIAAAIEGRRFVGAECDPETYAKAKRRIEAGYTPLLPFKEAL